MTTTDQTKLCVALMDYLYPHKPDGYMFLFAGPNWGVSSFNQPINYN